MDITTLYTEFKSETEKNQFIESQVKTILSLQTENKALKEEIAHLKQLLTTSTPLITENKVQKIILTPEEALLQSQIEILQLRGLDEELNLEDVKKLDLLLKNKLLVNKSVPETFESQAKKLGLSNTKLLEIAKKPNDTK